MTVYTISSSGAKVSYAVPTAGPPFPDCPFCCYAATCNPPPGSTFPLGTTTVTCSGSDGCGEHPTCSFNVTVAWRKHFFAGPNLPPLNGVYLSPVPWIGSYPKGILISNLIHRRFTQNFPPPPPGVMETHSFGSQVSFQLSTDGGRTFIQQSAMAQATVSLRADPTAPDLFDTEMTQLDITGGTLPAVMRIRESPTRASTGQTQVQPVPGGFMVSSFFDVFTEISLDGGQTWLPSDQPAPLELHTDPGYTPTALADFRLEDGQPKVTVMTQVGLRYTLLSKNNLDDPNWTPLSSISGNGQSVDLTDKAPGAVVRRFYRVLIEEDTGSATPSPQ